MKFSFVSVSTVVLFFSLTLILPSELRAKKTANDREVYITFVRGDVRVSMGSDHHPDLNQPWEQAVKGDLVGQGYALATGDGRAEIAFEDGSTVYLAENSLLLFGDLSLRVHDAKYFENDSARHLAANSFLLFKELFSTGDHVVSRLTLASGAATFALQPVANEAFFIDTPIDHFELSPPETFFARIDVYLDATAVTPQGQKGERVVWSDESFLQLATGKTVFFQGGEVIPLPDRPESVPVTSAEALGMGPLLQAMPDFQLPALALLAKGDGMVSRPTSDQAQTASEWDTWVSARVQERASITALALKASGLSSPIPGLPDLYEQGTFFNCEPYGTCWEPTEPEAEQENPQQPAMLNAQSPTPAQVNAPFQPQTVEWQEIWAGCPPISRTITRVAHSPEELEKILRRKSAAQSAMLYPISYFRYCDNGYWIPYRHHYARVVHLSVPPKCTGGRCKPIHAPRPVWVRVGNKVGLVPAHPNDVKGKPPINLKEGIIMPPLKPGDHVERVTVWPSQKVTVMDKAPTEFRDQAVHEALRVAAPEIHAHLVQEATRDNSLALSARAASSITYDYKSHHFVMPASAVAGTKSASREVAVGGIDSRGRIGSFADGHSSTYAQFFARSEAAGSYRGGSFSAPGSYGGYGSGYSGGGHGSGYSGSYSGGSHSSGSSYGGGSSHSSSGGGGSSGSSSSSSSSSSSTSSGGGSHGKP